MNFHEEMMEKIESWERCKICDEWEEEEGEGGAGGQAQILISIPENVGLVEVSVWQGLGKILEL